MHVGMYPQQQAVLFSHRKMQRYKFLAQCSLLQTSNFSLNQLSPGLHLQNGHGQTPDPPQSSPRHVKQHGTDVPCLFSHSFGKVIEKMDLEVAAGLCYTARL